MSDIVVTTGMVEDLLHRNKVDIKYLKKEIERLNEYIKCREDCIEQLLRDRNSLSIVLEEVKQNEVQ